MKKIRDSQLARQQLSYIKQRRKTFVEKLNFCNKMDMQLKLSTSEATSTTVQDVHRDVASQRDKEKPRQAYIQLYYCLRLELDTQLAI